MFNHFRLMAFNELNQLLVVKNKPTSCLPPFIKPIYLPLLITIPKSKHGSKVRKKHFENLFTYWTTLAPFSSFFFFFLHMYFYCSLCSIYKRQISLSLTHTPRLSPGCLKDRDRAFLGCLVCHGTRSGVCVLHCVTPWGSLCRHPLN